MGSDDCLQDRAVNNRNITKYNISEELSKPTAS